MLNTAVLGNQRNEPGEKIALIHRASNFFVSLFLSSVLRPFLS